MNKRFASGSKRQIYETIDSTNLEARRLIEAGETGPLWVIAVRQTAGYGRRGSTWFQAEGDVAASFIFTVDAPPETLAQLSYVAALSVSEAISIYTHDAKISLKWPNDVLLGGAKISGILLEMVRAPSKPPVVILGAGVNIVSKPDKLDYPAARLMDAMNESPPSPLEFVETIDHAFDKWKSIWRREGFGPIRERWIENAAWLDEVITIRAPDNTLSGVFSGIDDKGALMLSTSHGSELIAAGTVFFGETDVASH